MALWFVVAVFGCYLFYPGFDGHTRLRFLVPAIPPLLVLTSAGVIALANRLWSKRSIPLAIVVVAMAAWHGVTYARARAAFDTEVDWKYPIVGEYIARELPETAVLFAMQHSGSVRYYSGRGMVRYDQIPKGKLDRVVARLRRLGYRSYFVLEGWEEDVFRERFLNRSALGRLDWSPVMELEFGDVRIYDPADRALRWLSGPGHRDRSLAPYAAVGEECQSVCAGRQQQREWSGLLARRPTGTAQ